MLAVLFYDELGPGGMAKAREVYPRHQPLAATYEANGDAISIATFADQAGDGAMGIFRTREAAERFAAEDPFITEGVISRWRILDWNGEIA